MKKTLIFVAAILVAASAWAGVSMTPGSTVIVDDALSAYDAQGDILVGTGAGTAAKLSKGAQGKLLTAGAASVIYTTATYPVAGGTAGKILHTDGTNYVLSTATFPTVAGTAGTWLYSNGTNWLNSTATIPITGGTANTVLHSNGTNWVNSSVTFPDAAGSGSASAGVALHSNGTNFITSTATYPSVAGTARKVLHSNGTNFIETTETYAVPGTANNSMVSDGTNWTSAALTLINGLKLKFKAVASETYALLSTDDVINVGTGTAATLHLPATKTAGKVYVVLHNNGTVATTITALGGFSILGAVSNSSLDAAGDMAFITTDGTDWYAGFSNH